MIFPYRILMPLVLAVLTAPVTGVHASEPAGNSKLRLPSIFSDHMVLQRDQPVRVYGWAAPRAEVSVDFRTTQTKTTADREGRWEVFLEPQTTSFDPAELIVQTADDSVVYRNVLVGEVWLASGQSNMAWSIARSADADMLLRLADNPSIRLFKVPRQTASEPLDTTDAEWVVSHPRTARNFSAVAHAFGRDLERLLDTPVGLIDASWGGTPAIAWTRERVLDQHPLLRERAAYWDQLVSNYEEAYNHWQRAVQEWKRENKIVVYHEDPGIAEEARRFSEVGFDDRGWESVELPATFQSLFGDTDGAYWFRKTIKIPAEMVGKTLRLHLGQIDDYDAVWFNGKRVGGMDDPSAQPWNQQRVYRIPADSNPESVATLAIRVFDRYAGGGFVSRDPSVMQLVDPDSGTTVPLAGTWKTHPELPLEPAVGPFNLSRLGAPAEPPSADSPHRPASLANGMIAPVAPFTLRGVIWYQGEADAGWVPDRYDERLRLMIEDWRDWWQLPEMPFGIVQLANYLQPKTEPSNDPWPNLRESQRRLARELPHTGLAVTIDIGEANDIHPRDKATVGRRLARWALTDVYGLLDLRGGPEIFRAERDGGSIVLTFTQTGEGLHAKDRDSLGGFTIAGIDGEFFPAEATLLNRNQIRVRNPSVDRPVTVRYGWQNNPVEANLYNVERLPASPFEVSVATPVE